MTKLFPTRRSVLKGAAAASSILAAPLVLRAHANTPFVRPSMTSAEGKQHLQTYRKAVANMLSLPPTDPHNWYRYAMIHLMDCPHGNWWFFVWHRPYIGYLEEIVRVYGEDDQFALPYWDWSADPYVADTMFSSAEYPDNALDPSSAGFLDWASFDSEFHDPVEAFWNSLNRAQLRQETERGFTSFEDFWTQGVEANFTKVVSEARSKTIDENLLTVPASTAVEPNIIKAGLKPEQFTTKVSSGNQSIGFNSPEAANHHMGVGFAIIEGQPHNKVHNNLGTSTTGWMPSLLSSVDPIFFLHHCNVDRIWNVWTRQQEERGLSPLPTADEAGRFNPEGFLFYVNAAGDPAPGVAGEFMETERWNYIYTPGTGSQAADTPLVAFTNQIPTLDVRSDAPFTLNSGTGVSLALSKPMAETIEEPDISQIAFIEFDPPAELRGLSFDVFISPKGAKPDTSGNSPEFAGSFEFFGMAQSHGHPVTATLDITDALERLKKAGVLKDGEEVDFTVQAAETGPGPDRKSLAPIEGTLKSVAIEAI